jgi:adenylosuccinate lyase
MAIHLIDSLVFRNSWVTAELREIFDDLARTRDWLEILAALAETEAEFCLIPQAAAREIAHTCRNIELNDAFFDEVRREFETTNHSILGLLRAVAHRCSNHSGEWICYGAAVQDITDTWLARALSKVLTIISRDLAEIESRLAALTRRHRNTLMLGRTHGQGGLPITFGFKTAVWAVEIRRHRRHLEQLAPEMAVGQLAGGVGSLSSLGPRALELQESFLRRLGLKSPTISWTNSRVALVDCMNLMTLIAATGDKIGHEIYNLQRMEIGEVREAHAPATVGSITMPHKQNPEISEHVGTLARIVRHNTALLNESLVHDHERDGRSWKAEWPAVPEICCATAKLLQLLVWLLGNLEVDAQKMRRNLDATGGAVCSEAVMLALARKIGKQSAHQHIHEITKSANASEPSFREAIANDPKIREHLSAEQIATLFDYERQVEHCVAMVDRVLAELGRKQISCRHQD